MTFSIVPVHPPPPSTDYSQFLIPNLLLLFLYYLLQPLSSLLRASAKPKGSNRALQGCSASKPLSCAPTCFPVLQQQGGPFLMGRPCRSLCRGCLCRVGRAVATGGSKDMTISNLPKAQKVLSQQVDIVGMTQSKWWVQDGEK